MSVVVYGDLINKTCVSVEKTVLNLCYGVNDALLFTLNTGEKFAFTHEQNCCEDVLIEEIIGNLDDLIGSPILTAESVSNSIIDEFEYKSSTWTFFKFATLKGYVTVRWLGTSNGYYSENVDFYEFKNKNEWVKAE